MTERIYVSLLDEEIDVWRPVTAEKIGDDVYRISPEVDPALLGEKWEFSPGATVICQPRTTADGIALAAVRLAGTGGQVS